MHTHINVYVPNPEYDHHVLNIDQRSGIVGHRMVVDDPESPVMIWYEGNRFGAVNIVTFADRVYHAADRMMTNYPTAAKQLVEADAVFKVAVFRPEHKRIEIEDGLGLARLARWIDPQQDVNKRVTDPSVPALDAGQLLCSR